MWYHLYNFKNVKNTHGGVLLLVKLQGFSLQLYLKQRSSMSAFLELYKWYQFAQSISLSLQTFRSFFKG